MKTSLSFHCLVWLLAVDRISTLGTQNLRLSIPMGILLGVSVASGLMFAFQAVRE